MKEQSVAERACIEAGKVALKYFKGEFEVKHKGKIDLVTNADVECEQRIKKIISAEYPTHSFLGEEEGQQGEKSEYTWIIDPIDGTTNFSHGLDYFCHSIGLVKNGKIICGSVYNPVHKKLYSAYFGNGATLNGKKIHVSKVEKLIDSLLVTGFPYSAPEEESKTLRAIDSLRGNCHGIRRFGAAALDLCEVAQGSCDGFFEYVLKPWDVCAGILIVREAGGKVTNIIGEEANPYSNNFFASNSLLHEQVKEHLEAP